MLALKNKNQNNR